MIYKEGNIECTLGWGVIPDLLEIKTLKEIIETTKIQEFKEYCIKEYHLHKRAFEDYYNFGSDIHFKLRQENVKGVHRRRKQINPKQTQHSS